MGWYILRGLNVKKLPTKHWIHIKMTQTQLKGVFFAQVGQFEYSNSNYNNKYNRLKLIKNHRFIMILFKKLLIAYETYYDTNLLCIVLKSDKKKKVIVYIAIPIQTIFQVPKKLIKSSSIITNKCRKNRIKTPPSSNFSQLIIKKKLVKSILTD